MRKTKLIGYHLEFYCNHKYMGFINTDKPDNDLYGYYSRKKYICQDDIKLGKKTIKKGVEYYTEIIPIMGRIQTKTNK